MILIEHIYISKLNNTICIDLNNDDFIRKPTYEEVTGIRVVKDIDGSTCEFSATYGDISPIDYSSTFIRIPFGDLQPISPNTSHFDGTGPFKVIVDTLSGSYSKIYVNTADFYAYKLDLLDMNDILCESDKVAKKMSTFVYLEQMLLNAIENELYDDANIFYERMTAMSQLSGIGQKNYYK